METRFYFVRPARLKAAVRVLFGRCPDNKLIFMILQSFFCISCIHSPFAKAKEILSLSPIQKHQFDILRNKSSKSGPEEGAEGNAAATAGEAPGRSNKA